MREGWTLRISPLGDPHTRAGEWGARGTRARGDGPGAGGRGTVIPRLLCSEKESEL